MKALCGVKSIKGVATLTLCLSLITSPIAYIVTQVLLFNKTIQNPQVILGALRLVLGQGLGVLLLIAIPKLRELLV